MKPSEIVEIFSDDVYLLHLYKQILTTAVFILVKKLLVFVSIKSKKNIFCVSSPVTTALS